MKQMLLDRPVVDINALESVRVNRCTFSYKNTN